MHQDKFKVSVDGSSTPTKYACVNKDCFEYCTVFTHEMTEFKSSARPKCPQCKSDPILLTSTEANKFKDKDKYFSVSVFGTSTHTIGTPPRHS